MQNFNKIEQKWQQAWSSAAAFSAKATDRPKYYVLDMFPYPSGIGLHVGHLKGYVASDVIARYKRAQGFEVLHPMGWDSFGLPTERQAQKEGIRPEQVTERNIAAFRKQLQAVGLSFDWSRELATSKPDYYRWTQWIFCKLYERGLAYTEEMTVNWCPALQTVLANEEVANGQYVETGDPVERRTMKQWMLRITAYADRLLDDLDLIDWPEPIKRMQRNWIGRSQGAQIRFPFVAGQGHLEVFTTRPDTIFGATYMVIAPEHPVIDNILAQASSSLKGLEQYVSEARNRSDVERQERAGLEKTGVDTGLRVSNPATGETIPVWTSDYVLGGYGSGAVMAVPAHDERDFEFARTFDLPIRDVVVPNQLFPAWWFSQHVSIEQLQTVSLDNNWQTLLEQFTEQVIKNKIAVTNYQKHLDKLIKNWKTQNNKAKKITSDKWQQQVYGELKCSFAEFQTRMRNPQFTLSMNCAYVEPGYCINSSNAQVSINGLASTEAKQTILSWLTSSDYGQAQINYKLRDWLFSRQRYWGEPFPVLHGPNDEIQLVDENDLPVELPAIDLSNTTVTDEARSQPTTPLGLAPDSWLQVSKDGKTWTRETNTMPQWAGSCWYYLRFIDPHNQSEFCDAKQEKYWMPVDLYVGGAEHATLHLLYARFWHKVLFDLGLVSQAEPFARLFTQGMVHAVSYRDHNNKYYYEHEVEQRGDNYVVKASGEKLISQVEKMSKSKCNGAPPEDVINEYGADALRLYEMFMGPVEEGGLWDSGGVRGTRRFLDRLWNLFETRKTDKAKLSGDLQRELHRTIRSVTQDIESFSLNTAVSRFMSLLNIAAQEKQIPTSFFDIIARLLQPFAPHTAEEMWSQLGNDDFVFQAPWPQYDEKLCAADNMTIAVQVNGKTRGTIEVAVDAKKEQVINAASDNIAQVKSQINNKGEAHKIIYVPGRIINFVYKS